MRSCVYTCLQYTSKSYYCFDPYTSMPTQRKMLRHVNLGTDETEDTDKMTMHNIEEKKEPHCRIKKCRLDLGSKCL